MARGAVGGGARTGGGGRGTEGGAGLPRPTMTGDPADEARVSRLMMASRAVCEGVG